MTIKNILPLFIYLLVSFTLKAQLPPEFSDQIVSEGWDLPMGFTFDENERMYLWEKAGKVWIVDTNGVRLPNPLIDISEEVANWADHGLLGFALDPGFMQNGRFYLYYPVDRHYLIHYGTPDYHSDTSQTHVPSIGRITRYTADKDQNLETTIPGSRKILLGESRTTGIIQTHVSHSTGTLLFGTDGTLLASCGDGTSNAGEDIGGEEFGSYVNQAYADGILTSDQDIGSFKAQYLGSFNGKILRLNPETGDGIPSNPYYDPANTRSPQSRTWALGFRNPFRFIIRPETGGHNPEEGDPGVLYVGDVGSSRWEELNIVTEGGQNFGWPLVEGYIPIWGFWGLGTNVFNQLAPNPLFGQSGCDKEFFSFRDLFAQRTESGFAEFKNPCNPDEVIPESVITFMESVPVISYSHTLFNLPERTMVGVFNDEGRIEQVEITDPESPVEGQTFTGVSSIAGAFYTGDDFPEEYQGAYFHVDFNNWIRKMELDENNVLKKVDSFHDFGERIIQMGMHPSDGCLYYVSLTPPSSKIRKICYGGNLPPVAQIETDKTFGPGPLTISFDASNSYAPKGFPITYFWNFGDGSTSEEIAPQHTFESSSGQPVSFQVMLTITDSLGEQSSAEVLISLNNTPPKVTITSFEDGDEYPLSGTTLLRLAAEVEDEEHGEDQLHYSWETFFHHNTHFHPEPIDTNHSTFALISPIGCDVELFWYRIRLTVRDAAGLTGSDEKEVFPYCGPLLGPLTLTADPSDKDVRLNWSLGQGGDIEKFEIQRGIDQGHFSVLAESSGQQPFSYLDEAPLIGVSYYRIKMFTEDRAFDYSNTIKVGYPSFSGLTVFPNPVQEDLTIRLEEAISKTINLELFDALGRRLAEKSWEAIPGEQFQGEMTLRDLPDGIYYFIVTDDTQTYNGSILFIK